MHPYVSDQHDRWLALQVVWSRWSVLWRSNRRKLEILVDSKIAAATNIQRVFDCKWRYAVPFELILRLQILSVVSIFPESPSAG